MTPMRSPGGGNATGGTGAGLALAGRAAGFLAFGATRLAGAFFAGFFATSLRAAGRLAGAFLGLAFVFFRTAMGASVRTPVATCYSSAAHAATQGRRKKAKGRREERVELAPCALCLMPFALESSSFPRR